MRKIQFFIVCCLVMCFSVVQAMPIGNIKFQSFSYAKKMLEENVYVHAKERRTVYCGAAFDAQKNISLPQGFTAQKHQKRAGRVEWEHVVPAENFGRTFAAWREGDSQCVDSKGKVYKGRRCAEKVSADFRRMQADMYNLYPSIGAVNASRSNYNFTVLPQAKSTFGVCSMKIDDRKVEPPLEARGKIARAYLYMEKTYERYSMSKSQRQLMQAWNTMYPITQDECTRTRRIEELQGNENIFVKNQCIEQGMW